MASENDELLGVVKEMRDILLKIFECYEEQYLEIQRRKFGEKHDAFKKLLTPIRRKIFPLFFDPRELSQTSIANEVNTSKQNVNNFIALLLETDLVSKVVEKDGKVVYQDKYRLMNLLSEKE